MSTISYLQYISHKVHQFEIQVKRSEELENKLTVGSQMQNIINSFKEDTPDKVDIS